jgi:hypothetical protein
MRGLGHIRNKMMEDMTKLKEREEKAKADKVAKEKAELANKMALAADLAEAKALAVKEEAVKAAIEAMEAIRAAEKITEGKFAAVQKEEDKFAAVQKEEAQKDNPLLVAGSALLGSFFFVVLPCIVLAANLRQSQSYKWAELIMYILIVIGLFIIIASAVCLVYYGKQKDKE